MRAPPGNQGFTIIEILIAIVVLVLGITGILALFPTAIDSGNKTVEDSYSAAISQSVLDAIAVGLRETRYVWSGDGVHYTTYFLFDHDGVIDPQPTLPAKLDDIEQEMWNKDYCIILPKFCDASAAPARTDSEPAGGNTDKELEPVFLYPVPAGLASAVPVTPPEDIAPGADPDQRSTTGALDGGVLVDNFADAYFASTTTEETPALWLGRTYQLGRYRMRTGPPLPEPLVPGDIRLEFRGQDLIDPLASVTDPKMIALDPYPNYSFAFAIRRARIDSNGGLPSAPTNMPDGMVSAGNLPGFPDDSQPAADAFSNSLYELRIMIFKGFRNDVARELTPLTPTDPPTNTAARVPNTNVPIKQFITLLSI